MNPHINELTYATIGAAIEVHRTLGPGLLESSYRECLCRELMLRRINFRREYRLPLQYKGTLLDCGYRIDVLVDELVVVEIKSVGTLAPIHDAQITDLPSTWWLESGFAYKLQRSCAEERDTQKSLRTGRIISAGSAVLCDLCV